MRHILEGTGFISFAVFGKTIILAKPDFSYGLTMRNSMRSLGPERRISLGLDVLSLVLNEHMT